MAHLTSLSPIVWSMSIYTTIMQITILYDSIYIHDRNANNYSLWQCLYCYEHGYFVGIFGGLFYAARGKTLISVSRQSWGKGGGGQLDEEGSSVYVGKSTYLALYSLYTEAKAEWQGGGALATHWIPVLRERRASRRERNRRADSWDGPAWGGARDRGFYYVEGCAAVVTVLCCCRDCAVLRECSVLSLSSWCCDCTVLLLCWGWDMLCCCCAEAETVFCKLLLRRGLRRYCVLCLWECALKCVKGKEMSTSVSCHHLAARVLG